MRLPSFHYEWEWLLDAPRERLWPLVADTDRFNRDTGLPPVQVIDDPSLPPGHRRLAFRRLGILVEWIEQPFEWVVPRRFGVVRRYLHGPVSEMRVAVELLQRDDGARTLLRYRVGVTPANPLGLIAIPGQVGLLSRIAFGRVFRRYAAAAAEADAPARPPAPNARLRPNGRARLERAAEELSGDGRAELVERLVDRVRSGDELELARMRPYVFADEWDASRREVLELFMHSTRAGVLDLRWDLLCPLCRGARASAASLRELPYDVHCDTCNIDFRGEMDRAVEVTFRPNASVRAVQDDPFCVAGPRVTPHVLAQQELEPGAVREIEAPDEPGRYRVRCIDWPGAGHLRVAAAAPEPPAPPTVATGEEGWGSAEPTVPPRAIVRLENRTDRRRVFVVERIAWADDAATAAEVTALQTFRDLFDREVLETGDFRSVGRMAILFTDLRASTALYRRIGDAPAYSRVQRHFDVLRDAVADHGGSIVKTIGDAVMAVFTSPLAGVRAALRAQREMASIEGANLVLKAGLHFGPCLAVNLDDRLDYFGSTVNLAARLNKLSDGTDVVVSHEVRTDPEVDRFLAGAPVEAHGFSETIKGFDEPVYGLWRIRLREGGEGVGGGPPA